MPPRCRFNCTSRARGSKLRHSLVLVGACAIGLLLVSSAFVAKAMAWPASDGFYYGNGDGEFDCSSTNDCIITSGDAYISSDLSSNMAGTVGSSGETGYDTFTLQYNPDVSESNSYQTNADWLQFSIAEDFQVSPPAIIYYFYVANTNTGALVAEKDDSGSGTQVTGALTSGAPYNIDEWTDSSGYVDEITWSVNGGGSGAGGTSGSFYPETYGDWYWLRSNPCWCGMNNLTADFSSGSGTMYAGSSNDLTNYWGSPSYVGTAESSNMYYGCWSEYSSGIATYWDQSFSYSSSVQC